MHKQDIFRSRENTVVVYASWLGIKIYCQRTDESPDPWERWLRVHGVSSRTPSQRVRATLGPRLSFHNISRSSMFLFFVLPFAF